VPKTAVFTALEVKFNEKCSKNMERFAGNDSRFSRFQLAGVRRNPKLYGIGREKTG
jgi:hypothetical protein